MNCRLAYLVPDQMFQLVRKYALRDASKQVPIFNLSSPTTGDNSRTF